MIEALIKHGQVEREIMEIIHQRETVKVLVVLNGRISEGLAF